MAKREQPAPNTHEPAKCEKLPPNVTCTSELVGPRSATSHGRLLLQKATKMSKRIKARLSKKRMMLSALGSKLGASFDLPSGLRAFVDPARPADAVVILTSESSKTHLKHAFKMKHPPVLYASPANPGALEVAKLL